MSRIHDIKILKKFADDVYNGYKTFEVRKNDRDYQCEDIVRFSVVDDAGKIVSTHPLHMKYYKIIYILHGSGLYGIECGYVILEIRPVDVVDFIATEESDEEPFFPHLEFYDINFGKIGKETNYKDVVGRKLYTGDVVEIFVDGVSQGDTVIAEDKFGDDNEIKQFVMGIADSCNMEDGIISDGWKILKKRSYNDVKNGEKIDGIKFVTEE